MTTGKERMNNMARKLGAWMANYMAEDAKQRGESMVYQLKRGQRMYAYVGAVGRTTFCYTPHRDTNGDYWCFNLVRTFTIRKRKSANFARRTR